MNLYCLLSIFLFLTCELINGAEVKDKSGNVVFDVAMGDTILLKNRHHPSKKELKFSLFSTIVRETRNGSAQDNWDLPLSDGTVAKLAVKDDGAIMQYEFTWPGTQYPSSKRELCFHYRDAYWYPSYQRYRPEWPLDSSRDMPQSPFNYLLDFQNQPDKEEFYLALEHLFINSDGYAVMLDEKSPLFIRRNSERNDPLICISVHNSYPYDDNSPPLDSYMDIKLKIFAAKNVAEVWKYMLQKSGLIGKPSEVPKYLEDSFRNPSWSTYSMYPNFLAENMITDLRTKLELHGYQYSEIVVDTKWEQNRGDFHYFSAYIANPTGYFEKMRTEHFRVKLQVYPEYYDSPSHKMTHREMYITTHTSAQLTNFIDFSDSEAVGLYKSKLSNLHLDYGVQLLANSQSLRDFRIHDYNVRLNPSLLTKKYIEAVASSSGGSTTTLAYKTQHLPLMVQMSTLADMPGGPSHFDHILSSLIPNTLALSLAGYSFVVPYHIGGHKANTKPSEEQYIRMVQACTFLPVMSFSYGPWEYPQKASTSVLDITKKFVELHKAHVDGKFIPLAKERAASGIPMIRPMWFAAPDSDEAYRANDQFMLGDDLVVAPVVRIGDRSRYVFLPAGEWIDHHGTPFNMKSPGSIRVTVPLEDLPYYIRKR